MMTDDFYSLRDDCSFDGQSDDNIASRNSPQEESPGKEYTVEELLISLVMNMPPLWDSRLSLKERSKTIRDELWLEIYQEFGEQEEFSLDFLMKKWRNLRDTYVRLKGEYEKYVPSGSAAKNRRKKKWEFYEMMSFLDDSLQHRPTTTNLQAAPAPQTSSKERETARGDTPLETRKIEERAVETALVDALNRVNTPLPGTLKENIIPICLSISALLSKIPLKERTQLEIELFTKTYEIAKNYL